MKAYNFYVTNNKKVTIVLSEHIVTDVYVIMEKPEYIVAQEGVGESAKYYTIFKNKIEYIVNID